MVSIVVSVAIPLLCWSFLDSFCVSLSCEGRNKPEYLLLFSLNISDTPVNIQYTREETSDRRKEGRIEVMNE